MIAASQHNSLVFSLEAARERTRQRVAAREDATPASDAALLDQALGILELSHCPYAHIAHGLVVLVRQNMEERR